MRRLLIFAVVMLFCWKYFGPEATVQLTPGVKVSDAPIQKKLIRADKIKFDDYLITPLASFELKAKVLAKEGYSLGRESDLSPVDLALGWQKMSDESVINKIEISQSGRWYHWRTNAFPIPRREIETQSANMHLIPANDMIETLIESAKVGQIIAMTGSLVRVDANDGWHWLSSLTREDTGNHACEVVYVTGFELIH